MPDASSLSLDGRVALVTGASRGIGAETARALADAGTAVVLAARTSADAVAADIRARGGRAAAIACDVSDFAQVQAAVTHARDAFGGLDILVNNAGLIDPIARLADSDPAALGPRVRRQRQGRLFRHARRPAGDDRRGGRRDRHHQLRRRAPTA